MLQNPSRVPDAEAELTKQEIGVDSPQPSPIFTWSATRGLISELVRQAVVLLDCRSRIWIECTVVANVIAGCKSSVVRSNKRVKKTTTGGHTEVN